MAIKLESSTTLSSAYPKRAPPARSVAQLPGSMYPTATMYPGPAKARALRQNETPRGTCTEWYDSGRLGSVRGYLQAPESGPGWVDAALMDSAPWHSAGRAPVRARARGGRNPPRWSPAHRKVADPAR